MLFSEPKIPQSVRLFDKHAKQVAVSVLFSEPKIPQSKFPSAAHTSVPRFSALQRAENSSIHPVQPITAALPEFQCSSASRKFLNFSISQVNTRRGKVSVLFSEPKIPQFWRSNLNQRWEWVSVLFSEPKIPQSDDGLSVARIDMVSVLFSEPKIPQFNWLRDLAGNRHVSVLFSEPKIPQSWRMRSMD